MLRITQRGNSGAKFYANGYRMTGMIKQITLILVPVLMAAAGEPPFVKDELILRVETDLSTDDVEIILLDQPVLEWTQISRPLNLWVLKIDLQKAPLQRVQADLERQSEILYIQKNHLVTERAIPDDPQFVDQWNFDNVGQTGGVIDADIDGPEAWDITTGGITVLGQEIVTAVVDGGCDMIHPDLLANFWSNPADTAGNGIDDDGNGWVDDSLGWNAFGHNANIPNSSHGTHVAGTIGAHSNNGNQVAGVNWNVKLMIVAGASTNTSVVLEAYSYILEQKLAWLDSFGSSGAFVVSTNSSFGIDFSDSANVCESGDFPVWNDMYNALGEAGILSVAATANRNVDIDIEGDIPTGCSSPYIVAVTNTNKYDQKASAGYGLASIDLGAPGSSILSTNYFQGTSLKTGTSMAAPHVTGAIALMHAAANTQLAQFYVDNPGLGALIFKNVLLTSVDTLSALQDITVSGGRLNLYSAVLGAANWEPPGTGNMNFDNFINVQDVIILTQLILGRIESTPALLNEGDLTGDGFVTVQDLVRLIGLILQ